MTVFVVTVFCTKIFNRPLPQRQIHTGSTSLYEGGRSLTYSISTLLVSVPHLLTTSSPLICRNIHSSDYKLMIVFLAPDISVFWSWWMLSSEGKVYEMVLFLFHKENNIHHAVHYYGTFPTGMSKFISSRKSEINPFPLFRTGLDTQLFNNP